MRWTIFTDCVIALIFLFVISNKEQLCPDDKGWLLEDLSDYGYRNEYKNKYNVSMDVDSDVWNRQQSEARIIKTVISPTELNQSRGVVKRITGYQFENGVVVISIQIGDRSNSMSTIRLHRLYVENNSLETTKEPFFFN